MRKLVLMIGKFGLAVGGILLLLACNDDKEADIRYELTANIDVSEMAKGVKDGNLADIITADGNNFLVTVTYLIYDEAGRQVYKDGEKDSNFFKEIAFSTTLGEGNYTLVALAWTGYSEDVGTASWETLNENSLHTLKVKTNVFPVGVTIMGVVKAQITVSQSKNITLAVQPTGSFFSLNFIASSQADVKFYKVILTERNDEYLVEDEISSMETVIWEKTITAPSGLNMNGLPFFFFPVKQLKIVWMALDESGEILYYNDDIVIDIEKGRNGVIIIDLDNSYIEANFKL
jgi:hypothetical protein